MSDTLTIVLGWLVGTLAAGLVVRSWLLRRAMYSRVVAEDDPAPTRAEVPGGLSRWLALAGFRTATATQTFVVLAVGCLVLGIVGAMVLSRSGLLESALRGLGNVPGGMGELFLPLIYAAPWILFVLVTASPWLIVRSVRRKRVAQIEEDLPLVLELLATLGEAGLGFDAALRRVLDSQESYRPLASELKGFQIDLLAGQGRIVSLRRLASRVDVLAFTLFVSGIVQAEQTGSGVAEVLRRQADDLRSRRREQAIAFATALPVKLLFPLVMCFLPGIFIATLGPTFYQFFQFADALIRQRGGALP